MKMASEVHFEPFDILFRLRTGFLIHFHDIHYPFEYPDSWLCDVLMGTNLIP